MHHTSFQFTPTFSSDHHSGKEGYVRQNGQDTLGLNSKELLVVNILSDKRIQIFCQPRNKYHSKIENSFKWCFSRFLLPICLWDYGIYFAAQFTILLILRPPLGTVLLSFFTITSSIIITTSKQVGQRNVTAKKQSDGNFAFLRSPHF